MPEEIDVAAGCGAAWAKPARKWPDAVGARWASRMTTRVQNVTLGATRRSNVTW